MAGSGSFPTTTACTSSDPRCSRKPGQDFGKNLDRMFFVTPGGTTVGTRKRLEIPPAP